MGQADTHHQLRDARIGAVDCAQWRGEVRAVGTAKRKGTKVFALAGKIRRGALIEVPMGTTIREIVEESVAGSAMRPQKQLVKARAEDRNAAGCVYRFLSGQVARRPEKPFSSIMGRARSGRAEVVSPVSPPWRERVHQRPSRRTHAAGGVALFVLRLSFFGQLRAPALRTDVWRKRESLPGGVA